MIIRLMALLALVSVVTSAHAGEGPECFSQAEMQQIATNFPQFRDLANRPQYCLDGSQTSHLIAGIMFMRKTQFAPQMPVSSDEMFSGHFSSDWYNYFIGRIHDFDVQSSCPKGVGAYVYFFGNTMYVCPLLLSDSFTALDRASVFMHEARHIDGYPHTTCRSGPRAGLNGACDTRISDRGSYAVTVETYSQLARYATDLHPALKAYSRASAVTYAEEAFDTPARIHRQSQFILMSRTGEFHELNANKGSDLRQLGETPAMGRIALRAQHLILYPGDRTQRARYLFVNNEGEIQQEAGAFAEEYNRSTPEQRALLVDVHTAAQWQAIVQIDKVRLECDPRSTASREFAIGSDAPIGLIYPDGYNRASSMIYLAHQSGQISEIGCSNKMGFFRPSTLRMDQTFKRIHKAGEEVLGLTPDGRLFRLNGTRSTPFPTALDGQIAELAPNQRVDFFDSHGH